MMRMLNFVVLLSTMVLMCAGPAAGVDFYVDNVNGNDSNDGLSWANAFADPYAALAAMGATNKAGKAGVGGHSITITNAGSQYTVAAGNPWHITTNHSGAVGSPNVIRGVGTDKPPTLDGGVYHGSPYSYEPTFRIQGDNSTTPVEYVTLDNMFITQGRESGNIYLRYTDEIVIKNCVVYDTGSDQRCIYVQDYSDVDITNCVLFAGCYGGLYVASSAGNDVTLKNSIVCMNGIYGVDNPNNATVTISHSCIYGNGVGGIHRSSTYTTASEIGTDSTDGNLSFSSCVGANPGFANRMGDYTWDTFYDNSPCLTGGEGGTRMGWNQNVTTVASSAGTTYYVSGSGDGSDGLSWGTAWQSVGTAADAAVAGDTVLIGAGSYTAELTLTNGGSYQKPLIFRGEGEVTIAADGQPFNLQGVAGVTLDNFSLVSTNADALYMRYSFENTVTNCDLDGGGSSGDYGIELSEAGPNIFIDTDIHDSYYGIYGGTLYSVGGNLFKRCRVFDSVLTGIYSHSNWNRFEECEIHHNGWSGINAGHIQNSGLLVYNCLVYSNGYGAVWWPDSTDTKNDDQSQHGIAEEHYGSLYVYNSTIYGNAYAGLSLGIYDGYVYNCIFAGNRGCGVKEGPPYSSDAEDVIAKNCLFWDNGAGYGVTTNHFMDITGNYQSGNLATQFFGTATDINNAPDDGLSDDCENNLVEDPVFMSVEQDDYRVKPGSPVIDAGDAAHVPTGDGYFNDQTLDVGGNPRLKMTAVDIGAHEWQPWAGTVILIR